MRRVFWAAVWLAIVLVAIKAYYLGIPVALALTDVGNYSRSLAAISYGDVLFAVFNTVTYVEHAELTATSEVVALVIRPGYRLGGPLLRPAQVVVRPPVGVQLVE